MGHHRFLTADRVGELLDVDPSTVYRMAGDGRLPAIRVGRQWRFPSEEIERLFLGRPPGGAEVSFDPDLAQGVIDAIATSLGVMMVVIDLDGSPVTSVANPCPWFSERANDPRILVACVDHWRELAVDLDLSPRFRSSPLGFQCAGAFVRSGTRLVGMVLAGGIAPDDSSGAGMHRLEPDQRLSVLETLPRVAALLARVALRDPRRDT